MSTEIDLELFTGKNDPRRWMRKPFTIGRWTYATDGKILIRVPLRADVPYNPDATEAVTKIVRKPQSELQPLPHFLPVNLKNRWGKKCKACDWMGGKLCDACGHFETCKDCQGFAYTGNVPGSSPVEVGNTAIGTLYLSLIDTLPNPRIGLLGNPLAAIYIEFDGGDGAVMPMRLPR